MDNLLIFFALPIATILISIVLQTILQRPFLVAILAFGVYLIVTFAAFDASFLINAIIYTLLAYLTAVITKIVMKLISCREQICNVIEDSEDNNIINSNISSSVPQNISNAVNLPINNITRNNYGYRFKYRR